MTDDWRNSIDNKEAVVAVAVDLNKAFDAINHNLTYNTYIALIRMRSKRFTSIVLQYD